MRHWTPAPTAPPDLSGYAKKSADAGLDMNDYAIGEIKTASYTAEASIASTSGNLTVDWSAAQHVQQAEPTGTITYTFTAPPGPCHLQLRILSDGTSTAQTVNWPAAVKWLNAQWEGANNKSAIISLWYDGAYYWAIGSNEA